MSPTPEERIARLEARQDGQDEWLKSIDAKVDKLLEAANMGKGAWGAILKVGGLLAVLAGALWAIVDKLAPLFGKN